LFVPRSRPTKIIFFAAGRVVGAVAGGGRVALVAVGLSGVVIMVG
jgi:hypothetical protein